MLLSDFLTGVTPASGASLPEDYVFAAAAMTDSASPFSADETAGFAVARAGISSITVSTESQSVQKTYLREGKVTISSTRNSVFDIRGMRANDDFQKLLESGGTLRFVYFDLRTGDGICGYATVTQEKPSAAPIATVRFVLNAYGEQPYSRG